jgi:hypothetical protein
VSLPVYVTLGDPTPNRGTVRYVGPSRDDAADACADDTDIIAQLAIGVEPPELGERVWRDGALVTAGSGR